MLKTIAAFLNTEGGTLLIGVEDDGKIFGLEKDIACLKHGSLDKLERHLMELVQNNIGRSFLPFIKVRFAKVNDKDICGVYVRKSDRLALLNSEKGLEFYLRTGNASRTLKVPEIYDYL